VAEQGTTGPENRGPENTGPENTVHQHTVHEHTAHEHTAAHAPDEGTEAITTMDTPDARATTDTGTTLLSTEEPTRPHRTGPDPLALLVGVATLAMAVFAFVGELPDLSFVDPRWLLAGGAAAVGLILLVGNLRGRSGGRRGSS
jgi:hypothetical protein